MAGRLYLCFVSMFFSLGTVMAQAPGNSLVPGVIIDHSPASTKKYIGSPSICILPNGNYVASHDFFGPGAGSWDNAVTRLFESTDKGKTWKKIAEINQFWSGLFVHRKKLYLMGTRNEEGDCIIRRSDDGGHSWTEPTDSLNGLLIASGNGIGYHTSSVPVLSAHGRLWRGMEEIKRKAAWGSFRAFMMSVKSRKDLLHAANWTISDKLLFDSTSKDKGSTWLEGNAVADPKGRVFDMLRVHHPGDTIAAMIGVSADGTKLSFDSKTGFVTLPGATKKFSIRKDTKSKKYWTITNAVPPEFLGGNLERTRNTLFLLSSKDLVHWESHGIILQGQNVAKHGFQYVDWQFEGKDIVFVARTAYDDESGGADNQHNANYFTFHRITDFRTK